MHRTGITSLIIAGLLLSPLATAEEGTDLVSAIKGGKASTSLRYRYEFVDQDSTSLTNNQANASTARLRLNYRTGELRAWSLFGEFDYIGHVFVTDFNSGGGTSPDKQGVYPVVADPKGADLNQLYVDYGFSNDSKFRGGRQRINLDNQRFVGGVGWRQNEQTYDALTLTTGAIPRTAFSYSFFNRVRRIFGETSSVGVSRVDGHLLNAKVTINDAWSVVPYMYYLDYKDSAQSINSTATVGARVAGSVPVGDGKLSIVAELARQSDIADNPVAYDANYIHADLAWVLANGLSLGLGYESLGSDNNRSFSTPLATLHKFQGWADKFLATPPAGINDIYATVKMSVAGWKFTGVYHDFSAETGGGGFGKEFDVSAAYKITDNYSILSKGAFFSADSGSSYADTTKFWVMLTASY